MAPTLGITVTFVPSNIDTEVTAPSPAIVTAIHGDDCVNLQVINDSDVNPIVWRTSIQDASSIENLDASTACYKMPAEE